VSELFIGKLGIEWSFESSMGVSLEQKVAAGANGLYGLSSSTFMLVLDIANDHAPARPRSSPGPDTRRYSSITMAIVIAGRAGTPLSSTFKRFGLRAPQVAGRRFLDVKRSVLSCSSKGRQILAKQHAKHIVDTVRRSPGSASAQLRSRP